VLLGTSEAVGDQAGGRDWEPEDLVAHWTLVDDDWRLVANKTGPSRLGFALVLKFFELEARFPRHAEVHEGLQVVENWNSANGVLCYGKASELTGADREDQETTMLALHLLQSALVFINTIFLQRVLQQPEWADRLTEEDRRGLTPLFWTHVNPYGSFNLQMDRHLDLGLPAAAQ
jgi:hypothetical protein